MKLIKELINRLTYRAEWSDEDQVYIAYALEIPSVKAHASTPEEAIKEVKTPIRLALEMMVERKQNFPCHLVVRILREILPSEQPQKPIRSWLWPQPRVMYRLTNIFYRNSFRKTHTFNFSCIVRIPNNPTRIHANGQLLLIRIRSPSLAVLSTMTKTDEIEMSELWVFLIQLGPLESSHNSY